MVGTSVAVPDIGPDEVLIRVDTAGVGVWDPWVREGEFAKMRGEKPRFPYVLGADGSGTKRMGARVFAVASGNDGVELVRKLGAHAAVDGHAGEIGKAARLFAPEAWTPRWSLREVMGLLMRSTRFARARMWPIREASNPNRRGRTGVHMSAYDGHATPELFERLNHWIEAEPFTVCVAGTYRLSTH
jgi:hypothetical protein